MAKPYEEYLILRLILVKVILTGPSLSGKSSILSRYISNEFTEETESSIDVEFKTKIITLNRRKIKLQILEISRLEMFRTLATVYYKDLSAVVVVFDKSSQQSFESTEYFFKGLKENIKDKIITMLIGNKSDLDSVVSTDQGYETALKLDAIYLDVSAKTNESIENIFLVIASWVLRNPDDETIVLFNS